MLKKCACALLACLLALLPSALSESPAALIPIYLDGSAMLADASGREIVPPGVYTDFYHLNVPDGDAAAAYLAAGKEVDGNTLFGLMDTQGNLLSPVEYDTLLYEGGMIICGKDGLYGVLGLDGKVLIEPEYTSLIPNGEGGLLALKTDWWDDQPDGVYAIDASGAESATGVKTLFLFDSFFSEGKLALLSAENNRYGYVDAQGQWAVRPQFAFAMEFNGGLAVASISSGYGVIDVNGNWVMTPRYSLIWRTDDLIVAMEGNEACTVFDAATLENKFRVTGSNVFAYDDGERLVITDDEATRLYDSDGTLLFTGSATATISSDESGMFVVSDGPWGSPSARLYAADGTPQGEARQSIFPLGSVNGAAYFGYLEMEATPSDTETDAWDYDPYSIHYGLLNASGEAVTEAIFTNLQFGSDSCFLANTEDAGGLIDVNGEWIAKWEYEAAE